MLQILRKVLLHLSINETLKEITAFYVKYDYEKKKSIVRAKLNFYTNTTTYRDN